MSKTFDNENRSRYYGLRIGDIVDLKGVDGKVCYPNAEVVEYGSDNNRVEVRSMNGNTRDWVAEWCNIVVRVEDRIKPQRTDKPVVSEAFADNGEHSHWRLIDRETGKLLWSEFLEEDKILYK